MRQRTATIDTLELSTLNVGVTTQLVQMSFWGMDCLRRGWKFQVEGALKNSQGFLSSDKLLTTQLCIIESIRRFNST
ncbi:Uncharacterized protein APZ42_014644 [Daphnia magna]|uniref:Uncharacterized protein n=1 Tax=Daphnia magna TaxID=35525 RepID=A0A162PSB5_9CRUS|nr:Uncharacterized protein APZ42_014644 [Daphnia magna]